MIEYLEIYTDGSSNGRTGARGGWSCVVVGYDNEHSKNVKGVRESYSYKNETTNNEMELAGVYAAMCSIKPNPDVKVVIYTDSQYALNAITVWSESWEKKGWRTAAGKPVKNLEFVKKCKNLYDDLTEVMNLSIEWVRGHDGNKYNEIADVAAVRAKTEAISRKPKTFDLYYD